MKKRIYLASPFFNEAEIGTISEAEKILREKGLSVYSPREHECECQEEEDQPGWSLATYKLDVRAIDACEAVVMLYYGNYSDSGTAWECGYAHAKGKPVIVVHLGDDSNLMVHEGSHANVQGLDGLSGYDFEEMPQYQYSGRMF